MAIKFTAINFANIEIKKQTNKSDIYGVRQK